MNNKKRTAVERKNGVIKRSVQPKLSIKKQKSHSLIAVLSVADHVLLAQHGLEENVLDFAPSLQLLTVGPLERYPLPGLPEDYYFKGGAARELAVQTIFAKKESIRVRDYDIVRFMHTSDEHDHDLSQRFMSDDYEFGRGVEVVEDRATYFRTRDLTVNEVLAWNGFVQLSLQAFRDICACCFRPTPFVTNREGEVLSATMAKVYRFAAEAQVAGVRYSIKDMPQNSVIRDFHLALNLERCFASHAAVAGEYVQLLWEQKVSFLEWQVPPPLEDAIRYFAERISQGYALFKNVPPEILRRLV